MAERFDRWIASPQNLALPQSYDEFLLQESLPCLIEGCEWEGKSLSQHVNLIHGLTASEFKRAAGFNLSSGLVTPILSEELSLRASTTLVPKIPAEIAQTPTNPTKYYSLEGKEHRRKIISILKSIKLDARICRFCKSEYTPNPIAYSQRYCSVSCRSKFYASRKKTGGST